MLISALRGRLENRAAIDGIPLFGRGVLPQPLTGPLTINANTILAVSYAYRAVQIIADTISALPMHTIRNGKKTDTVPPLLKKPNINQTRVETIAQLVTSMCIDGNAYCLLGSRNNLGYPTQLITLNPQAVTVQMDTNGVIMYRANGSEVNSEDLLHIKAGILQPGALEGYGPIHTQRQTFATAIACEEQAAQFHVDGANVTGTLETDLEISATEAEQLQNAFLSSHGGRNAKPAVLSGGIKYKPAIGFSNEQMQWIESRKYNAAQIASLFGTPAWLIGAPDNGSSKTYANIQQDLRSFVQFTLTSYISRIEAALTELMPGGQTVKFELDDLLRSDRLTRYQAHAVALSNQFMTIDEVRESEDLEKGIAAPPIIAENEVTEDE